MIPIPRPGPRYGDCPNCGYRSPTYFSTWNGVPIHKLTDEHVVEINKRRMASADSITEWDIELWGEMARRGLSACKHEP